MADGGGGGGGGGGYNGGAGGPQTSGDNGAFSGSNGADLLPAGFVSVAGSNGGATASAGGSGAINMIVNKILSGATQTVTIKNVGNGANLSIGGISINDASTATGLSNNKIGYDLATFTGGTATFTVTASNLALGTHTRNITISSNAANGTSYVAPLRIIVTPLPNGTRIFAAPGPASFVVPADVHTMTISLVGGGGGAGGSYYRGSAGSVVTYTSKPVTPGETLSIYVGEGGVSRTTGSVDYYPVYLSYAWSGFMNAYAVWANAGDNFTSTRTFVAPVTGDYTFEYQADNYLEIYLDGALIDTHAGYTYSNFHTVSLSPGVKNLRFVAVNWGGPAGFAVTIKDPSGNLIWWTGKELLASSGTAGGYSTITGNFGTFSVAGGEANTNTPRTNGFRLVDGRAIYGPYGSGAESNTVPGQAGAVLLTWGDGDSRRAYKTGPQTRTVTSDGVSSGGGGPNNSAGTQYNTTGGNSVHTNYPPVSRYWIADSVGDSRYAWSQAIGFISLDSNITDEELRSWGFDPADIIRTQEPVLKSFAASVDSILTIGYAILQHGDTSIANARSITTVAGLSDQIADRHYRSSDSNPYELGQQPYGLGPWSLPAPGPNDFVYLWCNDNSGTHNRSITVTYS